MRAFLCAFLAFLLRRILAFRYKIKVKNLKAIEKTCKSLGKGILFLPNHPAEIDPLILSALLGKSFSFRPIVIEKFYYLKGAHWLMRWIKALPLPDFDLSINAWKIREIELCLKKVLEALENKENFLIYPSGRLKTDGKERIGGNSFVYRILQAQPQVTVVLIRTTGLWGSLFSRALTGESPNFWHALFQGFKGLLKNGIFFMPRRKVCIEFEIAKEEFFHFKSRLQFNKYLENWYNHYQGALGKPLECEPLSLVSLSLFRSEVPQVTAFKQKKIAKKKARLSKEIRLTLFEELSRLSHVPSQDIRESMELSKDLGLDSLDLAAIQAFLDERYGIETFALEKVIYVSDLCFLVADKYEKVRPDAYLGEKQEKWPLEKKRLPIDIPEGENIQEVFLQNCDQRKKEIICKDARTPALTYTQLKLSILILTRYLQKVKQPYIGVALPASVTVYVVILAILMAKKIPVVLNWTAGKRNLNFAGELLDLKVILSARNFLERVDHLDLGALADHIVLLEDVKRQISIGDKIWGLYFKRKNAKTLMKYFDLAQVKPSDAAVILFTSGTENYPKAVPLSHHNLLSNQRAMLQTIQIDKRDILYGVLPPFHSFGFSVTGLLPLLSGLRVFFSSDPTDSHRMARDCKIYQITLLCCAPSFYRNLFRVAKEEDLETVRLFVSGAEKASDELFKYVSQLKGAKKMIEGYGITECSPVVTIGSFNQPYNGVGKPLVGIEVCMVDPKTKKRISQQLEGEICISGPNVFEGYLGKEAPNPFIELEGKKWYCSGDLGTFDEEGNLLLKGRLKRFIKIGGEMVSLMALEEELTTFAKEKKWISPDEDEPKLCIGALEKDVDKPVLVLFATFPVSVEQVNMALAEKGFSRLVKIFEVRNLSKIPLTGIGKVHFHEINRLLKRET